MKLIYGKNYSAISLPGAHHDRDPEKNEDAYLVNEDHGTIIVADGLGGEKNGRQASHQAVKILDSTINNLYTEGNPLETRSLPEHFQEANKRLVEALEDGGLTTLSFLALPREGQRAICTQIGSGVIWSTKKGYLITPEGHIHGTSCMGNKYDPKRLKTKEFELEENETILVCTDGAYAYWRGSIVDEIIKQELRQEETPSPFIEQIRKLENHGIELNYEGYDYFKGYKRLEYNDAVAYFSLLESYARERKHETFNRLKDLFASVSAKDTPTKILEEILHLAAIGNEDDDITAIVFQNTTS